MPLESFPSRIAARFTNARTASDLTSVACGVLAMCWIQQALAGFGTSLISQTALSAVCLLALGLGFAAATFRTSTKPVSSPKRRIGELIFLQAIVAATVLFPDVFYAAGWRTIDIVTGNTLPESTGGQAVALFCGLTTAWLAPFVAIVVPFTRQSFADQPEPSTSRQLTIAALAAAIAMSILSSTFGLSGIAFIAFLLGVAGSAIETAVALRHADPEATNSEPENVPHAPLSETLSKATLAALCGVLFAMLSRVSEQLFFGSSWQSVIQCVSAILGATLAYRIVSRGKLSVANVLLVAAASPVAILAAWPAIVNLCLSVNSSLSTVAIAATTRTLIISACTVSAGLALGAIVAWRTNQTAETQTSKLRSRMSITIAAAVLSGWLGSQWLLIGQFNVSTIVVSASVVLTVIAAALLLRAESQRRLLRPAFAAVALILLTGPLLAHRYNASLSAKLLFDTTVFIAHQHEARSDILPYLDEGRCLTTAETDHGTLTFWRYRGQQLQVRSSGLPVSSVSCDTNICTQPSAESLQTILPMVMHEGPTRLMLLGVRSGAVLQTSIAFPLESIVCVEADQKVTDAVISNVFGRATPNPLDDSRVSLQTAEPLLKLKTSPAQADIIIAAADQQGIPQAASTITTEFLKTASNALREGGLYCQPLDYADFGPDAFQIIVHTWQSVFSEVAAVEIAPGKLLLIATNSPAGIIREGIVDRLQRPNVRFALAQTGWDWSTPLRLSVYTDKGLDTAFGESRNKVSDVASNRLTCLLPWEIMRWGDKYSAIMQKLGPIAQTLQFTIGEEAYEPKVTNRLAELTEQQELIHEHPDEFWFYRRAVKKRLKDTPQSELVQVKGEEPLHKLHENEKRRVDYFTALGAAAKQKKPGLDDLLTVEEYASPHDPLISLFLHQEVAELATRNRDENFALELQHRLHRIYFTASNDQAVRNVVAAIEILCQYPEAIPEDAARGDQLDALLQVLHDRWHNRGETPPGSSKIVLNDIEQSVAAIDSAFDELGQLSNARGYSPEQWQARKLALEKSLLRPLQAYRSTLMPHHVRKQR